MSQFHFHPPSRAAVSWCSVSTQTLFSCSSPMAFALSTYMNHTGIRSREPRVASSSEKAQALPDKDKWLPFFPKAKKVSGEMAAVPLLCSQLPLQRVVGMEEELWCIAHIVMPAFLSGVPAEQQHEEGQGCHGRQEA